jgi:hypothetical protein
MLLVFPVGCPSTVVPGDVDMGTYEMHADLLDLEGCSLSDGGADDAGFLLSPASFDFEATFSQQRDSGAAFMTITGSSRSATFDGQVLSSTASATRTFSVCAGCTTVVVETVTVSLLSRSQGEVSASVCPDHPLDGGTPAPDDAGVTRPGLIDTGFDAVLACGELHTHLEVADGGSCPDVCRACTTSFSLQGGRK